MLKPKGTGIRTGAEYLEGLRDDREIWMHGARVRDVTAQPGIARGAATLASFLDRQHDPKLQETVTYKDTDGDRCAMSFMVPKSAADIAARGRSFYEWATWSNGMFGRTPDYKNASIMAFGAATGFLAQGKEGQTDFAANMTRFYDHARKNDLVLTHTLVNPTMSHAEAAAGRYNDTVALQVVKETDAGVIVNGARLLATLGPSSDEIEVFPSTILKPIDENIPFAFAFALPIATPGLRMICRDAYDHGKSTFDTPLAARFEEMDAVVIFENVLVPWERIFMYREPALCNQAFGATNAVIHMMHQVAAGKLAKSEFMVGLMCAIAQATGKDKDLHVKGMISEVMQMTETVRALLMAAEAGAHEDEWGNFVPLRRPIDACRNLFPKMYPRMVELLQMLGSSSLMATPAEADFSNEIAGDVERYFQVAHRDARDRVALFRLAHDVAVSGFGSRQCLYERFFFGPPPLLAAQFYDLYPKDVAIGRVESLLADG